MDINLYYFVSQRKQIDKHTLTYCRVMLIDLYQYLG